MDYVMQNDNSQRAEIKNGQENVRSSNKRILCSRTKSQDWNNFTLLKFIDLFHFLFYSYVT